MNRTSRSIRPVSWLAIVFVLGLQFALVPSARACSCAMPGPMADYRGDPDTAIFTAIVEPRDGRGYPATVTRWFQGGLFEPRVWFSAASFSGDGASCGVAPLPVATEWIFVAYRIEGGRELGTGLCSPHAPLTGPDGPSGQAMLADAVRTFGGPQPVTATPPPNADPLATPVGADTPDLLVPVVLVAIVVFGLVSGLVAVLGRLRRTDD